MPRQAIVYTVVIASPADTENERRALSEAVHAWNATHSAATGVVLQPVVWEIRSTPEMGDRQIIRDADILVGVFWTRLGTPTGEGTVQEIEEFRRTGKRVLLYFSDAPAIPSKVNREQYERLEEYRERGQQKGLVDRYDSLGDLRQKFDWHVMSVVRGLQEQRGETSSKPAKVAAHDEIIEQRRQGAPHLGEPLPPTPSGRQVGGALPGDDSITEVKAGGWRGVQVGHAFYAWEGPLNDLPDRDPVEMPSELNPRLKKALTDAGALPSWQSKRDLLTFRDEQRLFITDRKTYKRAIVCGKENVLVVHPTR